MNITYIIGGAQGFGIETAATLLGNAIAQAGYYLYGDREYYSTIKNRHSYTTMKISDNKVNSINSIANILIAIDAETVFQHFTKVSDFIIYDKNTENININAIKSIEYEIEEDSINILKENKLDTTVLDAIKYAKSKGVKSIAIDYNNIIMSIINELNIPSPIAERTKNIIGVGASFALLGLNFMLLSNAIIKMFKDKMFLDMNMLAAKAGYDSINKYLNYYKLKELKTSSHMIQIDGNTASAIGKMIGGLRFQAYYPITPASDESVYIEANQIMKMKTKDGIKEGGAIVFQTEDELAAINSAIGAALTGARSATATSGPGFSLMSEGISWAGMNEVPVLITYYMRGAPSTGLPTRSSQSDLMLAMNVGHGEFPRIVIASSTHEEIIKDAAFALNLAEKYQTPIIHIIEKTIANSYSTINEDKLDIENFEIDRGKITDDENNYYRFKFSDDGISSRAFLGKAQMFYSGDEHNEFGHIDETSQNRLKMYEKRNKKIESASKEIPAEHKFNFFGDKNAENIILTWGSPTAPSINAIEELKSREINIGVLQIKMFNPYPKDEVIELLKNKKRIIAIENNYYAQGAEILTLKTRIIPTHYILKWTGRAIADDELIDVLIDIIKNNKKRVVLDDK
jgi:2-oxoglutarate ferredoxin oxidoreductase subunit alpha